MRTPWAQNKEKVQNQRCWYAKTVQNKGFNAVGADLTTQTRVSKMAGTKSDLVTENPQEKQDMKTMFKSMMKEFKYLKQTVVTLMDNLLEGKLDEESDAETSLQSHGKDADKSRK